MLCLARKLGEAIVISTSDGLIKIQVTDIYKGQKVRLGFTAPESIQIDREEIYVAKQRSKWEREKEKKSGIE